MKMEIFNVTEFVCYGKPGDGCGCEWKEKTLYFENEKELRTDLQNESKNWIKWCWIKEINDYRVMGIKSK